MTDKEMIECSEPSQQMERLKAIMQRLRAPGGCPWDAEQTHESLIPHLIEEAYETVDAIRSGDTEHLKEELGDLLLQVVFHSEIATCHHDFTFEDVAKAVSNKLIRRHPHVYSDSKVNNTEGVLSQWDAIKRQERNAETNAYLDRIGEGLPSALKAAKLQKKASKVGFDWQDARSILDKIREELAEVEVALDQYGEHTPVSSALEEEIGDLLFTVINFARKLKVDPEMAIDQTNRKFIKRFTYVENALSNRGVTLKEASLEMMEEEWLNAKHELS